MPKCDSLVSGETICYRTPYDLTGADSVAINANLGGVSLVNATLHHVALDGADQSQGRGSDAGGYFGTSQINQP